MTRSGVVVSWTNEWAMNISLARRGLATGEPDAEPTSSSQGT